MPTSFAACVGVEYIGAEDVVRRMLEASACASSVRYTIATFPRGVLGFAHRTDRPRLPFENLIRSSSGSLLAIAGLPTLPAPNPIGTELKAIAEMDCDRAIRALTALDGAFFALFYDAATGTVVLISDFFGAMPVYAIEDHRGIALSTTIRAFSASGLIPLAPNPAGWGGFVGAKYFVGDDTSVDQVRQVRATSVRVLAPLTDRVDTRTYWQWPETDLGLTLDAVDTGEVLDAVEESVARYQVGGVTAILPLSGGFESRLLLGILGRGGARPLALSVANPYEHFEIEARFAQQVAAVVDVPFERAEAALDFFSSPAYLAYVHASEVGNTSVNLPIAQLDFELVSRHADACWEGVMVGLLMKDFSNPTRQQWAVEYLSPESALWRAARLVFASAFVDSMRDGLHATVAREVMRYDDSLEGHTLFFNSNRARRRAMPNPLKIFGRHAWPFLPGLTRRCVEVLWRIPIREKVDERLYRRVLERHFPELIRIPFCSHGHLLPGAGGGLGYRLLAARSAVVQHPRVGEWLRRAGIIPDDASEPRSVATALARVDLDSPFLDADSIRGLRATGPTRDCVTSMARELVFYWDSWQRIMSGEPLAEDATALA